MTEKQKKLALIAGTIIVGIILLLSFKKGTGTIVNQNGMAPIDVSIPSLNMPVRSPFAFNIPGLPSATPYNFNAISPCMCNGSQTVPLGSGPGVSLTFVTNQGNSGPNVYNYTTAAMTNNNTNCGVPIYCPVASYGRTQGCIPGQIVSYDYSMCK